MFTKMKKFLPYVLLVAVVAIAAFFPVVILSLIALLMCVGGGFALVNSSERKKADLLTSIVICVFATLVFVATPVAAMLYAIAGFFYTLALLRQVWSEPTNEVIA